jgi:deoxycytidylate deaminase
VNNTIDLRKFADDAEMDAALVAKQYDKVQDKYDYLTHMPMHNMNKSRVQKILREKEELIHELDILEKTELSAIWLDELEVFEKEYAKYKASREQLLKSSVIENKKSGTKSSSKSSSSKKK